MVAAEAAPKVSVKRSEEHTSELQSLRHLVCRLLLEKSHARRSRHRRSAVHRRRRGRAAGPTVRVLFFNDTAPTEIYPLSLHDALPIWFGPLGGAAVRHVGGVVFVRQAREVRSEEHTSELQSLRHLVCRLLLEKKK